MEDLKQMWQQYDEKLERTQSFNEQILRKMNKSHSASRIEKMRNMEYLGLFFLAMLFVLFITRSHLLGNRWELKACFILVTIQILGWAAWTVRKIVMLGKLDVGKLSVTEMLRRMDQLRLMLMRERLWGGLSALLFLLVPATIVVDYWMDGSTAMLNNWRPYIMRMILPVIIGMLAGLWAYRRFYMRPIDDITRNLREIEDFSSPGT